MQKRIIFNQNFRSPVGEFFFDDEEQSRARVYQSGFIVIEPSVRDWTHANKYWGDGKYEAVAKHFLSVGHRVMQFKHRDTQRLIDGVELIEAPFRDAVAILQNARLYIGPEGALHHAAAAVGLKGVVVFGDFIPPQVTGYAIHRNLTGKSNNYCGSLLPCEHCRRAM